MDWDFVRRYASVEIHHLPVMAVGWIVSGILPALTSWMRRRICNSAARQSHPAEDEQPREQSPFSPVFVGIQRGTASFSELGDVMSFSDTCLAHVLGQVPSVRTAEAQSKR